ncbi:MAG: ABC transporter permease [Cyclobacteriaceae bacterium]
MVRNYILTALRNIRKHKFFAAINIIGLSLSMSVCLVIILLVSDHFQYDKFHPKRDRIFRITTFTNGFEGVFDEGYATSPLSFREQLTGQYAFIETATNLNHRLIGEIRSPHKILELNALFADENFFDVFGFELLEGTSASLKEPYHMVLSESLAKKLFPVESPVGQTVAFENHGDYKVAAVVKTPPGNSHMEFEALASFSTLPLLVEKGVFTDSYQKWENIWSNYNYLVLNDARSREEAERVINELGAANMDLDEDHPGYVFRLQGINEIVPGRSMSNEIKFALPWFVLAFFSLLGLIVIITATINYTNLSIAKSLSRTKEIGIRKVNGALRSQIALQFLVESVIISLISLVVAVIIYKGLVSAFNEIWIFSILNIHLEDTWRTYIYFFVFTLTLGLITGIGPSLFLSKIDTISSLKGSLSGIRRKKKTILSYLTGKRTLLGVQFTLSIIMLVTILVLRDQANFLVNANYGFEDDQVFFVEIQGHDPEIIKNEFSSIAGVNNVSFTSHHPAIGKSHGDYAQWKTDVEAITLYHFAIDENYVDVMNLELIAGNDLPNTSGNEKFILLNEQAVEVLGFESPNEAVGQFITMDSVRLSVSGILRDYHWDPLMKSIRPLGLRIKPEDYEHAYFQLSNIAAADYKEEFESKWNTFDPAREFRGGFLDEKLDEFYQFFYDMGKILAYVALLAVVITSLGFLGMVSFEIKTRVKEIGIRKVLGASFGNLTFTMSKSFFVMIIVTTVFAVPVSLLINGLWVNQMASHAPMGIVNAIPALIIIGSIGLGAIVSQVWISSRKNPSETLRAD